MQSELERLEAVGPGEQMARQVGHADELAHRCNRFGEFPDEVFEVEGVVGFAVG